MEQPTDKQSALAHFLGLTSQGCSKRELAAKLRAELAEDLLLDGSDRTTTDAQLELASQLAISNLSSNRAAAAAQIEAALVRLNEEAIQKYRFSPGMLVEFVGGPHVHGLSHAPGARFEVSSISRDGRVFFRKTTGFYAYPCQLRPVEEIKRKPNQEVHRIANPRRVSKQ